MAVVGAHRLGLSLVKRLGAGRRHWIAIFQHGITNRAGYPDHGLGYQLLVPKRGGGLVKGFYRKANRFASLPLSRYRQFRFADRDGVLWTKAMPWP
jgi:hypothetical protein